VIFQDHFPFFPTTDSSQREDDDLLVYTAITPDAPTSSPLSSGLSLDVPTSPQPPMPKTPIRQVDFRQQNSPDPCSTSVSSTPSNPISSDLYRPIALRKSKH